MLLSCDHMDTEMMFTECSNDSLYSPDKLYARLTPQKSQEFIMRKYIGIIHCLMLLCLAELLVIHLQGFANDPGVGWHLQTGFRLLNLQDFPYIDPFLASEVPRRWISDQWLSDLILALLYRGAGWPLLYSVLSICYFLAFFVAVFLSARTGCQGVVLATLVSLIAFKMAAIHFILRPVVFGILLFACCYYLLLRLQEISPAWRNLYLFALFALWVNIHGTFILGLLLVGIFIAPAVFLTLPDRNPVQTLLAGAPLCISLLATLCNPYGIYIYESFLKLSLSAQFLSMHEEWHPLNFQQYASQVYLASLLLILLSSVMTRKIPGALWQILSLLVFAYLAQRMVRMLPYFAIVAAPPLAIAIQNFASLHIWRRSMPFARLLKALQQFELRESQALSVPLLSSCLGLILLLSSFSGQIPFFKGPFGPDAHKFPYEALDFMEQIEDAIVLAPPHWGGFLVFASNGHLKPVLDDRNQLLGEQIYFDFYDAIKSPEALLEFAKSYKADYLLMPEDWEVSKKLLGNPALLYHSKVSLLLRL